MNKKSIYLIEFILFIFIVGACNVAFGKYILQKRFNINAITSPFYFNASTDTENVIMENDLASMNLSLNNYNSESEYNKSDTKYQIALADSSKYSITVEDSNGSVIKGGTAANNSVTINFEPVDGAELKLNEDVTLLITSMSPYKKQISKTININKPDEELVFGGLSDFKKITLPDCDGYSTNNGTYETLYAGNNEEIEYDSEGNMVFDEDNPILVLEVSEDEQLFQEEYSIYFTIKADVNQGVKYGNTIASIGNGSGEYIAWVSIYQGYLHVYSYVTGNAGPDFAQEAIQKGFGSYDITEYSNTIFNVQITCSKTGVTKVYINGEELTNFESGGETMPTTDVCIGDLRPLRNLKFIGTIYDFAMYNSVLTEEEVQNNWKYAQNEWINE